MPFVKVILFGIASLVLTGCINDLSERYELRAADLDNPDAVLPASSSSQDKVYWLV